MNTTLEKAYRAWSAAADLRQRRERYKNYTYGKQWADIVTDSSGRSLPEEQLLIESGAKPLSNNLIRQLVKTVVGRFRTRAAEDGSYSTGSLASIARRNALPELDSRALEEFLISGCAIQRVAGDTRRGCRGIRVDNVDPRRFFVNDFRDPRGWDIELVGMLHDMSFPELIDRFAGTSKARQAKLRHIYSITDSGYGGTIAIGEPDDAEEFFNARSDDRCRVIEVWTYDCREGSRAAGLDFAWHCRWLAPDGTVLAEHDSPFAHRSHPFVVKLYPLTDGEVHSFVEDVIDQQRYINRLIVMIDKMMTSSAKGVLLFPEDQRPAGLKWEQVTKVWARSDGVIPITGKGTHLPQQVVTNTAGTGAYQLLDLQMKLFEDISGVGDALLGRSEGSARGVEMLDARIRNATIALADIFDTFTAFTEARNEKALATEAA
ncbi:MAG: hypothetical protein NC418_09545 [Muribaculaceae bacterium]|nr:hypothetical protein [Muribaculaceae bacterium]